MAEKVFIGKVTEKTFDNGGSIIKLKLSPEDKAKLVNDWNEIEVKKSTKGNWYAELSQFQPTAQPAGVAYQRPVQQSDVNPNEDTDLPF